MREIIPRKARITAKKQGALLKNNPKKSPTSKKVLTLRQALFVREYLLCGNHKEAAQKAGYKTDRSDLIISRCPIIQNAIKEGQQKIWERAMVTKEWKIKKLMRCADVCMPDDDLKLVQAVENKTFSPPSAISAIAEMNKMQGDYAPTNAITTNITTDADNEEIKSLLEKYRKDF